MANELTWKDEQDIAQYHIWKIDNDWHTKGYALMPTTIAKETTVYTLEELEALGWSVHKKAIENILTYEWKGFEPSFLTENIVYSIGEDFPLFELNQRREGKTYRPYLFWGMNPYTAEAKGTVDVARFMTQMKLRNKYRLVWEIMRKHGLVNFSAPVAFGSGMSDHADLSDLQSDIEYCDETPYKSERGLKIEAQITALEGEIEGYVGEVYSVVIKHIRLEDDYRSSDEFAKEEAEAHELTFTEDGDIYHG